jgi:signal transduction histidine kinase
MTPEEKWLLQKERVLAWLRAGFALVALLVTQLDVSPADDRFPLVSDLSTTFFLLYSLIILYLTRQQKPNTKKIGLATTSIDLACISLIVLSTGGSATPFFVYYLFPIITASSRYGIRGGLITAFVGVVLYAFIRFGFVWETRRGMDIFIVRSIYLFLLAYIFGFLSESEKKQNQKLLALSKTAGEVATHEERRRIARELHDGLLQSLATHLLRLETCRKHFLQSPKDLNRELQSIEDDTRDSMKLIRRFLANKETQSFPPGMLLEYLKGDLRFLRDGLGMQVVLQTEPEDLSIPEAIEHDLYFVLREGLMNITRHAQASRADLILSQMATEIRGSLSDDGIGFDPKDTGNGHGLGLMSMKERMEKLRGELDIQSSPGKGARIFFAVPLAPSVGVAQASLSLRDFTTEGH